MVTPKLEKQDNTPNGVFFVKQNKKTPEVFDFPEFDSFKKQKTP